jgi:hypothetical protein
VHLAGSHTANVTVPAFPLTRILIITDAWLPQINGVVRSIEALLREAPALGVEIKVLSANEFRTVPLPTYPQVRAAVTRPAAWDVESRNSIPILSISRRRGRLDYAHGSLAAEPDAPLRLATTRASQSILLRDEWRRADLSMHCFVGSTMLALA